MSALANHLFIKMNGLGNEIVVVDMRAIPEPISTAEARAADPPCPTTSQWRYTLAQITGTDAFVRIYNNDGTRSRHYAGLACAVSPTSCSRKAEIRP